MFTKILRSLFTAWLSLTVPGLGIFYCGFIRDAIYIFIAGVIILAGGFLTSLHWDYAPYNIFLPFGVIFLFYIWVGVYSFMIAWKTESPAVDDKYKRFFRWYYFLPAAILIGIVFTELLFTGINIESFRIPVASMGMSLMEGDYLIADMNAYDESPPEANDIVIFLWPGDGVTTYVKRCVATEGQTVEIINKALYINDSLVPDLPFIIHTDSLIRERPTYHENSRDNWGPYIIPDNSFFMLGDNRDNSYDSRFWGPVRKDLILGEAIRIYWSNDFDRIGQRIR